MNERRDALMTEMLDQHAAPLLSYCRRLTADPGRAEDVAQETLLRAWQRIDTLVEKPGSLRSWLLTVARNIVIDEWRTQRSQREFSTEQLPEPAGPPDPTEALVLSYVVADAMGAISAPHRSALVERYHRGRSTAEAAAALGVPEGTVKSRVHLGLRALRVALEQTGVTAAGG